MTITRDISEDQGKPYISKILTMIPKIRVTKAIVIPMVKKGFSFKIALMAKFVSAWALFISLVSKCVRM